MLILQDYSPADYPALKSLYRSRAMPVPAANLLAAHAKIAKRHSDGLIVAAGFLYVGDGMSWLSFLCTSPLATSAERHEALDGVMRALMQDAKQLGCRAVVATLRDKGLIERHHNHGFQTMEANVTSLFKKL